MASANPKLPPSREGLTTLTVWLDPEVRKGLKKLAVEHEVAMQDLVETALRELIDNPAKFLKRIK